MKTIRENKLWVAIGIVAVLLIGLAILSQPVKAQNSGQISFSASLNEVSAFLCSIGVTECPVDEPEVASTLGALTGPDIPYDYIGVGGLREHRFGRGLSASSTVCSFQPEFGTTTVKSISFQSVGTTSATILVVAKGSTAFATTTPLVTVAFAASIKGTVYAATTTTGDGTGAVDSIWTLGPTDFLNFDVQGLVSDATASTPNVPGLKVDEWRLGTCGVELQVH